MDNIIECKLDSTCKEIYTGIWQHDYGQILRITGVDLPKAVEVQFSLRDKGGDTLTRIGTTVDGVTEVKVPDSFLKNENCTQNYLIYAWIYVTDDASGNTEYQIILHVKSRPKPEEPTEEPLPEPNIFHETVEAVNASADRAAASEQNAKASATEASKYAASASESAVAAEKTKEDALKGVGEKKQEAIEAIQKQEETSVGKIIDHTDNEIQRIQNQTAGSKRELEQTIANAGYSKEELDESIQTAGDTKTALDKSTELAGTAKTELDTFTQKAGEAKTALDGSAKTAGEMQETLNATVKQAGALDTSLGEKIKTGTQLKTDLVASGEKAVQDIQTAGSEQLGKMQAVSEEFTADREKITTNKEDIGSLKEDTAVLQKRQNVLVGSETGNPVSCDDAFAALLCGLTVYGKSTQDGTPTPDAPVPIVSAGDGGSVAVKVTGKNRMPPNLKRGAIVECFVKKNTPITLVFKGDLVSQGGNILFFDENNNQNWFGIDKGLAKHHITFKTNVTKFQYLLNDTASENVCLTWNASSPDYEPYREQLLTLPTPNGLPGSPVTSGGNYTDPQGQQWVCDEIDLKKGVKVQRIASFVIDAKNANDIFVTNTYTHVTVATNARLKTPQKTNRDVRFEKCVFCEALPWLKNQWASTVNGVNFVENDSIDLTFENSYLRLNEASTDDERKTALVKYFTDNPCQVIYRIATPIENPLTSAEIAAYKALTTYGPDTVVQVSDGTGIKLDYQRDVNLVVKNLEDAIASMTTT